MEPKVPNNVASKNLTLPKVIFFDLDNTLYPHSSGLHVLVKKRIRLYLERMGMTQEESSHLSAKYYSDYGLAIRGLLKHHDVDARDYDDFVDGGLPIEEILRADAHLHDILNALKCKRWVFTNADIHHTMRTLRTLGISGMFDGVTHCNYADPAFDCKPERASYERAMRDAGVDCPEQCLFIDDSFINIRAAKELGWSTVYICEKDGAKQQQQVAEGASPLPFDACDYIDFAIKNIHELPQVLPQEWFEAYHTIKDCRTDEYCGCLVNVALPFTC